MYHILKYSVYGMDTFFRNKTFYCHNEDKWVDASLFDFVYCFSISDGYIKTSSTLTKEEAYILWRQMGVKVAPRAVCRNCINRGQDLSTKYPIVGNKNKNEG